jgi:hypothetical protein
VRGRAGSVRGITPRRGGAARRGASWSSCGSGAAASGLGDERKDLSTPPRHAASPASRSWGGRSSPAGPWCRGVAAASFESRGVELMTADGNMSPGDEHRTCGDHRQENASAGRTRAAAIDATAMLGLTRTASGLDACHTHTHTAAGTPSGVPSAILSSPAGRRLATSPGVVAGRQRRPEAACCCCALYRGKGEEHSGDEPPSPGPSRGGGSVFCRR